MSGCDSTGDQLVSFETAIEILLSSARVIAGTEELDTSNVLGRVLAQPLVSSLDVPPLDNSSMDGYAVLASDITAPGTSLPVSQRIVAGAVGTPLQAGTAARIFTGAPVPANADAVVMQELCIAKGDEVTVNDTVQPGQNIRKAGEDISIGTEILKPGVRLRAQELGLAASIGLSPLTVYRKLRVGIFFTGDELVTPGNPLGPGQIYNSNRYSLIGLLQAMGCEIIDLGIVPDDLESTKAAILSAIQQSDLVITSGGVSVGEEDHVCTALDELGELSMWRIAMKPGKPLVYGNVNGTPFIGLPGNPVSVYVTFCLFVSPYIKTMQGMTDVLPTSLNVMANFTWPRPGKRREYLRARLSRNHDGNDQVEIYPHQGSGVLTSTSWADGLVVVPVGATVEKNDMVEYLPFKEFL